MTSDDDSLFSIKILQFNNVNLEVNTSAPNSLKGSFIYFYSVLRERTISSFEIISYYIEIICTMNWNWNWNYYYFIFWFFLFRISCH